MTAAGPIVEWQILTNNSGKPPVGFPVGVAGHFVTANGWEADLRFPRWTAD